MFSAARLNINHVADLYFSKPAKISISVRGERGISRFALAAACLARGLCAGQRVVVDSFFVHAEISKPGNYISPSNPSIRNSRRIHGIICEHG